MVREPLGGAAAAPVIRATPWSGNDDAVLNLRQLLPAWIISGVVHVIVLSLFLLVAVTGGSAATSTTESIISPIETAVDTPPEASFPIDELGDDPRHSINYDLHRQGDQSIPGPERPLDAPGSIHGTDIPPVTAPPPPGAFRPGGENGGLDSGQPGAGLGNPGGGGGILNSPMAKGRTGIARERSLERHGGNARSEAAVAAGIKWLVRHQALDGRWSLHEFHQHGRCNCGQPGGVHDVAATGLGLLPLLGAGGTHLATGVNNLHAKNIERALKWMITQQGADGSFSRNGYEHSIATYAICEAYGLTGDPWLRGPAQRALTRCVTWQRPQGGFRYAPPPAADQDLSVSGWFVQALKSGQMAGLSVPNATWAGVNQYLGSVGSPNGDMYEYQEKHGATPAMTAVGLLCREYLGWGPRNPALAKGIENLEKAPPGAVRNIYYYYYATQVVYHVGGPSWNTWNPKMRDLLIDTQDMGLDPDRRDQKGSWSATGDAWGSQLGRLGYTSLALLTLEVYYRYLPLYRRELAVIKDEAVRDALK